MSVQPQNWLITGGAGYIGSHIADEMLENGSNVIIYDSLRDGLESRIDYLRDKHAREVPLIIADIKDKEKFEKILKKFHVSGIVHAAALKSVDESNIKPDEYMDVNYHATVSILEIAKRNQIGSFIFCSSAAVYGNPNTAGLIRESDSTDPRSPYGETKLLAEKAVESFLNESNVNGSSIRFFNVIGTASPELVDNSKANLVPIVIDKLRNQEQPIIYGRDYPTLDGTCVRDYIDVRDIASAIFSATQYGKKLPQALNIGAGREVSVLEVVSTAIKIQKVNTNPLFTERRLGDPARLCADISLARELLKFEPKYSLFQSITSQMRQ
jgi:UDP-glucose 4-epimerase